MIAAVLAAYTAALAASAHWPPAAGSECAGVESCASATGLDHAPAVLRCCGVAVINDVVHVDDVELLRAAFSEWQRLASKKGDDDAYPFKALTDFNLRGDRIQTQLPPRRPFVNSPLIKNTDIMATAEKYFGSEVELDTEHLVQVPGAAPDQDLHRDVGHSGSVSVMIPLQDLHHDFGPLAFCPRTHHPPFAHDEDHSNCVLTTPIPKRGAIVMYDSAVVHRGCANERGHTRLALYVSYRPRGVQGRQAGLAYDYDPNHERPPQFINAIRAFRSSMQGYSHYREDL